MGHDDMHTAGVLAFEAHHGIRGKRWRYFYRPVSDKMKQPRDQQPVMSGREDLRLNDFGKMGIALFLPDMFRFQRKLYLRPVYGWIA